MKFIITVSIILVGVLWLGMMFGSFFWKICDTIFKRNKGEKKKNTTTHQLKHE
jgi:hypothetical protein